MMIAVERAGEISMTGLVVLGKSSQLEEVLGYHAWVIAGVRPGNRDASWRGLEALYILTRDAGI